MVVLERLVALQSGWIRAMIAARRYRKGGNIWENFQIPPRSLTSLSLLSRQEGRQPSRLDWHQEKS